MTDRAWFPWYTIHELSSKLRDLYVPNDEMMTSSNGNIFRVTGPLCGEFTGPGEFPTQRPVTRSFDVSFDLRLNNDWVNNREAGDLRRYRGHYDVTVMNKGCHWSALKQISFQWLWWHMSAMASQQYRQYNCLFSSLSRITKQSSE